MLNMDVRQSGMRRYWFIGKQKNSRRSWTRSNGIIDECLYHILRAGPGRWSIFVKWMSAAEAILPCHRASLSAHMKLINEEGACNHINGYPHAQSEVDRKLEFSNGWHHASEMNTTHLDSPCCCEGQEGFVFHPIGLSEKRVKVIEHISTHMKPMLAGYIQWYYETKTARVILEPSYRTQELPQDVINWQYCINTNIMLTGPNKQECRLGAWKHQQDDLRAWVQGNWDGQEL